MVFGYEEPSFKIIEDDIHIPLQLSYLIIKPYIYGFIFFYA